MVCVMVKREMPYAVQVSVDDGLEIEVSLSAISACGQHTSFQRVHIDTR